jgi:hypothetical protein
MTPTIPHGVELTARKNEGRMGTYPRGGKNTQGSVVHASLFEIVIAASKSTALCERVCIETKILGIRRNNWTLSDLALKQLCCDMAK